MAAYGNYLRALLAPLGIYDLSTESFSGSEGDGMGAGLDTIWYAPRGQAAPADLAPTYIARDFEEIRAIILEEGGAV